MKLTIIIPAYNEGATIAGVVERVPKEIDSITETAIVVVDDGSTDNTKGKAIDAGARVVSHYRNLGVGQSMRSGFSFAIDDGADVVVTIDADGQFNPEDIPKLIQPIIDKRSVFVTCSRFCIGGSHPPMPLINIVGNKALAWFISKVIGTRVYDVSCGFRAYSKDALLRLNLFGRLDCNQEVFVSLARHNIIAQEVPLQVNKTSRPGGQSRVMANTIAYSVRLGFILLRTVRDINPFLFFGLPGLFLIGAGIGLYGLFVYTAYVLQIVFLSDRLGTVSWTIGLVGFILFLFALFADMVDRIKISQEEALFHLRKERNHNG